MAADTASLRRGASTERCDDGAHNDISPAALDRLLDVTRHPERLQELVVLSRQLFGWFTKHEPRSLEYPWLVERCRARLPRSAVDIGAGVSPVPVWLAEHGVEVVTIDHHPLRHEPDTVDQVDEWGFLDYELLHPGCLSLNMDASTVQIPAGAIDLVYSISVVEHMPADVRRAVLANAAGWQSRGGRLLLTVDLAAGEDRLWNRDQGREVEPVDVHGTFDDLLAEVEGVGYRVVGHDVHRWTGSACPVDIGFVEADRA